MAVPSPGPSNLQRERGGDPGGEVVDREVATRHFEVRREERITRVPALEPRSSSPRNFHVEERRPSATSSSSTGYDATAAGAALRPTRRRVANALHVEGNTDYVRRGICVGRSLRGRRERGTRAAVLIRLGGAVALLRPTGEPELDRRPGSCWPSSSDGSGTAAATFCVSIAPRSAGRTTTTSVAKSISVRVASRSPSKPSRSRGL